MLKELKLEGEFIKLDQLLKIAEVADSGGHAKILIIHGEVKVNGDIVMQRGKKVRAGDIVEVEGIQIKVV